MKRCPECRRDYFDDTLSFCLEDGAALLHGVWPDESATAILSPFGVPPSGGSSAESQTRAYTTGAEAEPPNVLDSLTERRSLSAHRAAQPRETGLADRKPSRIVISTLSIVGILVRYVVSPRLDLLGSG
ncbi:MAG TPA: hypothetical protein VMZ26_03220 [Pyrinomonadaceae bacterium]|nr:hypothetical protein [Pyrinomonadaceae bacterium]